MRRPARAGTIAPRMDWAFIYMMFVLKLPIAALLGIVWWAIRSQPEPADTPGGGGGGAKKRRPHPRPPLPRHPRRGPHHGAPAPLPPPRTRAVVARARPLDHA
jgi:hypothetical protein